MAGRARQAAPDDADDRFASTTNRLVMARIFLTGATGFIGTRLLARLADRHEVWAVARHLPPAPAKNVNWLVQDLAAEAWSVELPRRIDAVIHLAQSPHYRDFPERARDVYAIAAGATMRLLEWAQRAGATHFVLASTGGLYGTSGVPVRESDPVPEQRSQLGFYFASKRASELLAIQYAGELASIVLRFFFVYGAGQSPKMLMPRLVGSIREGRPVQLQGEDGMKFNPIHADDATRAIEACLTLTEARVINIAGPEATSLRHVSKAIGRLVGRDPIFEIDATAVPNHLVADIGRMTSALGAPRTGIEKGLTELCTHASLPSAGGLVS
jgi:nucleoside-diphosphate-sugar epimerase